MRIIAGRLGGRLFKSTNPGTHPMSEKMRGALFNSLGDIVELRVLDAFAGSGALSFEAVSRGAGSSLAIESNRLAQKDINGNISDLKLSGSIKLIPSSVHSWARASKEQFDLVFCDPPYDNVQPLSVDALQYKVIGGGLLILSWPPKIDPPKLSELKLIDDKSYGDGRLVFYRNSQ
jgi:16S rRNA (guanine966-N2)-methyltransferase